MMFIAVVILSAAFIASSVLVALLLKRKTRFSLEKKQLEKSLEIAGERLEERDSKLSELTETLEKQNKGLEEYSKMVGKQAAQIEKLKEELNVNPFDGRFPICSECKDIRDSEGYWHPIEEYIQNLSNTDFSHSLCPNCAKKLYPEMFKDGAKPHTLTWK
jgi:DNA repair exonuclease SbcCD ATPase subunit